MFQKLSQVCNGFWTPKIKLKTEGEIEVKSNVQEKPKI